MIIDLSTIITAVACILYIFFVIFGFIQYRRIKFFWSFQVYMSAMAIWSFGSFMMHADSGILTPLMWNRFMIVGLFAVPFTLVHAILDILEIHRPYLRNISKYSYLLMVVLIYLNIKGFIVEDAGFNANGFYYKLGHWAVFAYSLSYIYLLISIAIIYWESRRSDKRLRKNFYLYFAGVIIMLFGILLNLNETIGKYPFDILAAAVNALILFYAIYKFKLVNYSKLGLNVIFTTILWAVASIIYFLVIQFTSTSSNDLAPENAGILSILLGFVTAIIIHPMRNLMAYMVDKVIIPRRHPYQKTIKEFSQKLTTIVDLNELGEAVVKSITTGINVDWVAFIIRDYINKDENTFKILSFYGEKVQNLKPGGPVNITFEQQMEKRVESLCNTGRGTVIWNEYDGKQFNVSESLPEADIVLPLVFRKDIGGYIIIGAPKDSKIFSKFELDALEILSGQCSLSLKNSISFEQLKKQGNELIFSNNKLEAIFNGIGSPLALVDIDYTIIEINNAAEKFIGKSRKNIIGKKCYKQFFDRKMACPFCKAPDCLHAGLMMGNEAEVNEHIYSLQFHSVKVPQNSKQMFLEIIQDITEQKKMQNELVRTEKMAGIGAMAAGIAHELNNPLAGIAGTAEILLSEIDGDSELKEYAEDILSYSMNAADVIKEISLYSRKEEKNLIEIDIIRTLEFSVRLAKRGMDTSKIEIERNYHALPTILANEGELQQVFLNIVVNAVQAMDEEGVLSLTCKQDHGVIYVSIADSGIGIPKENLNQIFTPFFTTKEPGKGTGLGLSNCYKIVEKFSGRINVESKVGEGTKFTISFPASEKSKEMVRFVLASNDNHLNDAFYIQRKVLIGEKGYIEESIHRDIDEEAMHLLAYQGVHPVGTVSMITSSNFKKLPINQYFDIDTFLKTKNSAEMVRLAVLPEMRNSIVTLGLTILMFLYGRAQGVEEVVIDVFTSDTKTIKMYKKFGFHEIGTYNSPSSVTV
ncbi:MAG: PAS domain S-box protein, partial [Spirochaetia bacterium]|nr:PAS domain S-box protein [Spirochaetia bacterium]